MEAPIVAENPKFDRFVQIAVDTHHAKNHDYAEDSNPYSNFEFAARFADVPVNTVFDVMIGIKQARLLVLRQGREPLNESIQDSEKDLAIYAMLKASYNLPAAAPTQKIDDSKLFQLGRLWCSQCGKLFTGSWVQGARYHFCPNCTTEMELSAGDERFDPPAALATHY